MHKPRAPATASTQQRLFPLCNCTHLSAKWKSHFFTSTAQGGRGEIQGVRSWAVHACWGTSVAQAAGAACRRAAGPASMPRRTPAHSAHTLVMLLAKGVPDVSHA